jgi:hypothetical protein
MQCIHTQGHVHDTPLHSVNDIGTVFDSINLNHTNECYSITMPHPAEGDQIYKKLKYLKKEAHLHCC